MKFLRFAIYYCMLLGLAGLVFSVLVLGAQYSGLIIEGLAQGMLAAWAVNPALAIGFASAIIVTVMLLVQLAMQKRFGE